MVQISQGRPTPDSILGEAAPIWRETMKNLHAFARATNCPLGVDVIQWFACEVARLSDAMTPSPRPQDER
jgi:hypothetical protein